MKLGDKFFESEGLGLLLNVLSYGSGSNESNLKEIVANSTEAAGEKHIPVAKVEGKNITVEVGSIFHPMTEEHSIGLVVLKTDKGGQYKVLSPNAEPVAHFTLSEDENVTEIYAYCNLHGLWKSEIQ